MTEDDPGGLPPRLSVVHDVALPRHGGRVHALVTVFSLEGHLGEALRLRLRPGDPAARVSVRRVRPVIDPAWRPRGEHDGPAWTASGMDEFLVRLDLPAPGTAELDVRLSTADGRDLAADVVRWRMADPAGSADPAAWGRRVMIPRLLETSLVDALRHAVTALEHGDRGTADRRLAAAARLSEQADRGRVRSLLAQTGPQPPVDLVRGVLEAAVRRPGGPAGTVPVPDSGPGSGEFVLPDFEESASLAERAVFAEQAVFDAGGAAYEEPAHRRRRRPVEDAPPETAAEVSAPTAAPVARQPRRAEPGEQVVSTGFADRSAMPRLLDPNTTLTSGQEYLFWLTIGPADDEGATHPPQPAELPPDATVTVVLFDYPGEIELRDGATIGQLRLHDSGAVVLHQPFQFAEKRWWADRLAFPVRMPARRGAARMRCNVYWNQLLLQSRLIEVVVAAKPTPLSGALRSVLDFRVADPAVSLAESTAPRYAASLQLDDDGSGTHALRVFADDGARLLRAQAGVGDGPLSAQIGHARAALHRVAWGADGPWRDGLAYRYAAPPSYSRLADDLAGLAVAGHRLHHLLTRGLGSTGKSGDLAEPVRAALASPGYVQIALREGTRHVPPAALLYDYPLDTEAPLLRLCADFDRAVRQGTVAAADCFRGECAQASEPDPVVVCPGGFWGYRHALGLPVSIGSAAGLPDELDGRGGADLLGGVHRDFPQVGEHEAALGKLARVALSDDTDDVLRDLRSGQPHVVYFHCRGGVEQHVPYLRVTHGAVITPDTLYQGGIAWPARRPLVFLNACRAPGLTPEAVLDFVGYFVQDAEACGVVGADITVFEETAAAFAEDCLRGFLVQGLPIGSAVRHARIALLAQGNPLGLAFTSFVLPTIQFLGPRPFDWFTEPA